MYSIELLTHQKKDIDIRGAGSCHSEGRSGMSSGTFSEIENEASSHSMGVSSMTRSTEMSDAFTDISGMLSPFSPEDSTLDLASSSETTILEISLSVDRHAFIRNAKSKELANKAWGLRNKHDTEKDNTVSCTDRSASTIEFSECFTDTRSENNEEKPCEKFVIDTVTSCLETNLEVQLVQSHCDQRSKTDETWWPPKHISCDDDCQNGIPSHDVSDAFTWASGSDVLRGLSLEGIWSKTLIAESASSNSHRTHLEASSSLGEPQSKFKTLSMPSSDEEVEVELLEGDQHGIPRILANTTFPLNQKNHH